MSNLILYFIWEHLWLRFGLFFESLNNSVVFPFYLKSYQTDPETWPWPEHIPPDFKTRSVFILPVFIDWNVKWILDQSLVVSTHLKIVIWPWNQRWSWITQYKLGNFDQCKTISDKLLFIKKYPYYQFGLFVHNYLL